MPSSNTVNPDSTALQTCHILVTRPAPLGQPLCAQLQALGATAHYHPVITLSTKPCADLTAELQNTSDTLHCIFVSRTAVKHWQQQLTTSIDAIASQHHWYAVGPATQQALEALGLTPVIGCEQSPASGESLLKHPRLQAI